LNKRLAAEAVGTALLLAAIVGSGIMAERLASENLAIALLANSIATGGALVCLIAALGPISGGHFNPIVSLADALGGGLTWVELVSYVVAQLVGAVVGVVIANVMFSLPAVSVSHHARSGPAQLLSEGVATFGLVLVIWGCARFRRAFAPFAVAAYIVAAYWFTPSTSFANPALTLARALSDTFTGIRPQDVPGFIVAEVLGGVGATWFFAWLAPIHKRDALDAIVAHHASTAALRVSAGDETVG
jgi:glycerol uptake facilitator-like aquaporin